MADKKGRHVKATQQDSEAAREKALLEEVRRFHMATLIRQYVNAVQADALVKDRMSVELDAWLTWARGLADSYDPFRAS